MTLFDIALSTRASLHSEGEPDDFISSYGGIIRAEGDDGILHRVGRVNAYRVQVGLAINQGVPLFEVFDAHSHEMFDLFQVLFAPETNYFSDAIMRQFEPVDPDLLILDYVILNPRWRGLKLGLLAARKLVDLLGGGCGLVVSHIAPLRHEAHEMLRVPRSWLPRHKTAQDGKQATGKLRRYFRLMGFERIGRSCYYGLSMARLTPTLSDLLRPSS
jgi:hypothetical protein